ncbi:mechanosensitive ion channel family protein [Microbacterium sp. MPKO10]|uniref:mechanosensitive ion channel family protein n=1 Tax=Microbacterium sp. MPKO10 TaxID=2989818 RepID=UPI002235B1D0|nr:mechanosensitive ion channel family protein [Microbacterium sp. MPKO10]MCW4459718.1 mechanosensitive ion channel family protein [Microbacterium sp. MPKO10]
MRATDFWQSLDGFFATPLGVLVRVVVIIAVAIGVTWLLHIVIRRAVVSIVSGVKRGHGVDDTQALAVSPLAAVRVVQRTRTLGTVLSNIINVIVVVITVLLLIHVVAPGILSSFALLSAAIGAGLGFGAQNIVKDTLNGIFMVIEDQLGVGDVVDVGFATGVVEKVGIRITQIRDVNGVLWFVRNGEVLRVGNMSQGWSRLIIDLAIPRETDLDAVKQQLLTAARALADEPKWRPHFLDAPEAWGLESISDDAVVLRMVAKTRTSSKDDVGRELRLRFASVLEAEGVPPLSLETVILAGWEGAASVGGARPPRTKPVVVNPAKLGRKKRTPKGDR